MAKTTTVPKHPGVYSYETETKGKLYACSTTLNGKQVWKQGFRTIRDAEEWRRELHERGVSPARMTMKEYLESKWLPSLDHPPTTMRMYRQDVGRIVKYLGSLKLAKLEPLDIEQFKEGMRREGLAPRTCSHAYSRLNQALNQARRWRLIRHNPCEDVDRPRIPQYIPPLVELPTPEMLKHLTRLFEVSEQHGLGLLVYFATLTGMRAREVFGLEWSHIDFATGWLNIPRLNTKTDKGARPVLLDAALMRRLQEHRLAQLQQYQLSPRHVFLNHNGKPWEQSSVWKHWRLIREEAGVPDLHFHDLRHVQGTLLARVGVHPSVAQQRLGHADISTTLGIYTHVNQEGQVAAVEGLVKLFEVKSD